MEIKLLDSEIFFLMNFGIKIRIVNSVYFVICFFDLF